MARTHPDNPAPGPDPALDIPALLAEATPAAADALAAIAETGDKATAKAARRALHLLRSRGVAPVAAPIRSAPAAPTVSIGPAWHAYMATGDEQARCPVVFVSEEADRTAHLVVAAAVGGPAVLEIGGRRTSKREADAAVRAMTERSGVFGASVPFEYARALVAHFARERAAALPRRATPGAEWLAALGEGHELAVTPLVRTRIDPDVLRHDGSFPREPQELVRAAPLLMWRVAVGEPGRWVTEVEDAMQSRLVLTDAQRAARIDAVVDRATDSLFMPAFADAYQRTMEESALVLDLAGEGVLARQMLYHALMRSPGAPVHEHAVLRLLVQVRIAHELSERRPRVAAATGSEPPSDERRTGLIHRV